jgi:hypothetical protein
MEGNILAKFLPTLIIGTPQKVFFGSFTKLCFRITILLKHLSVMNQAKEHKLLKSMPFMGLMTFSASHK